MKHEMKLTQETRDADRYLKGFAAGLSAPAIATMSGSISRDEVTAAMRRYRLSIGFERVMPLAALVLDAVQHGWLTIADAPLPDQQFSLATWTEKEQPELYEPDKRPNLISGKLAARTETAANIGLVVLTGEEVQLIHGVLAGSSNQALVERFGKQEHEIQQEGGNILEKFGLGSWAHFSMEAGLGRLDFSEHFEVPCIAENYEKPYEPIQFGDIAVAVNRLPYRLEADRTTHVIFEQAASPDAYVFEAAS